MRKEQGITLIELLVSISILCLISTTIYGIFNSINKNFYLISGKSSLEQEANLILTTIKNYHQQESSYKLSYDAGNKNAFIGKTTANIPLERSDLDILIQAGYPVYTDIPREITIDTSKPIHVYIKLTDKRGQSYSLDTIIKRY